MANFTVATLFKGGKKTRESKTHLEDAAGPDLNVSGGSAATDAPLGPLLKPAEPL